MVAVPLCGRKSVIGLLEAFSTEAYAFNESDVKSLTLLAELILGYARGEVPDYQMAAFCMAVFFRGLTPHEMFEVVVKVVGARAAGFRMPAGVPSLLPSFPSDADVVGRAGYAPLFVTMAHGDDLAAAVSARATGSSTPSPTAHPR